MRTRQGDEKFTLSETEYFFRLAAGAIGFASDSPFAPKSTSGERSYADYDPFSAVAFANLDGGMGQERATDVTRYYDAENVDARGGRLILGPLVHYNSETLPGLDTDSDALLRGTNTVGDLDYLPVDATRTKVACSFVVPTGITGVDRVWLPLKGLALAATITADIYSNSAGAPSASLGSSTLSRDELSSYGGWAQFSFQPSLPLSAGSTYWLVLSHAGTAGTLSWYGGTGAAEYAAYSNALEWDTDTSAWVATTANWHLILMYDDPNTRPDSSLRYLLGAGEDGISRLWGYSGRRLYYIGAAGVPVAVEDGASNVFEAGSEILDAKFYRAVGDTHAFIWCALGDSTDMVKFDCNIGTEEWAAITEKQARRLAVHDDLLWFADEVNQIAATDGTTYGTGVAVGDKTYPIRNMLSWQGDLYVGKDDGLYAVTYAVGYPTSGSPVVSKVIDFSAMANPVNFAAMVEHQGDLVFSLERGLLRFTSGNVLTPITPDTGLNLSADERATYRAAYSSLNVLWVCAEGSLAGKSSLLALVDWHWHPIVTVPRSGDMMRSVHVEPGLYSGEPRVWFKAGLQVAYASMPTTTQKRWLWSSMDYAPSGTIDLPWVDGNIRTVNKDWIQVEIDASHMSETSYANVYYRVSEEDTFTLIDSVTTDGISTLAFPASTYGSKVQLRIGLVTGTSSVTPHVEAVVLKFMERPKDSVAFTRVYNLTERAYNHAGARGVLSIAEQVQQLETLRESAEPLTWYPWWGWASGKTYSVHIVNYAVTEYPASEDAKGHMAAVVKLQKV